MTDRIIYDRVWLDDYLNQLKQYENCLRMLKENLYQAKNSLSMEQAELYQMIIQELDKIECNFQVMNRTVETFMDEAQRNALELEHFSEEQYQQL